jgi:hypothetical protein
MAYFKLNNKLFLIPDKPREIKYFHYALNIFSILLFSFGLIGAIISLLLPYMLLPYTNVNNVTSISLISMILGISLWGIHKYVFTQDWLDRKLSPPSEIINFTDESINFQNPESHETIKSIQEEDLDKIEITSIEEVKALPTPVMSITRPSVNISTEKSVIIKIKQTSNQKTTVPLKDYAQTYKAQKKLAGEIISYTRGHLKTVDIEVTN